MSRWFIKRIGQSLVTIFAAVTLTFGLIRFMPGGPIDYLRAQMIRNSQGEVNVQQINELVKNYININPDEPVWIQYADYWSSLFMGDMGESLILQRPVIDILVESAPWTVFLMSTGVLLAFVLGVLIGAVFAYIEGSRIDLFGSSVATVMNSTPYYIVAILLVMFLAYQLPIFPAGGRFNSDLDPGLTIDFFVSVLYYGALPILSVVLTQAGWIILAMRGNSISILGEDYIRVARLRGIFSRRIATRYVARNAILPLYTAFLITITRMFGGSVILEEIFNYPGLGYYIYQAVLSRDYPLLMGGFLFITFAIVIGLLIGDLTYGYLDPRAGTGGGENEVY